MNTSYKNRVCHLRHDGLEQRDRRAYAWEAGGIRSWMGYSLIVATIEEAAGRRGSGLQVPYPRIGGVFRFDDPGGVIPSRRGRIQSAHTPGRAFQRWWVINR